MRSFMLVWFEAPDVEAASTELATLGYGEPRRT
jgi:hypothetical protein